MTHDMVNFGTALLDECPIDAHRDWQRRQLAPAYMRGVPTWIWKTAMHGPG